MPRTISYQDMLDREGSDIAILLSPSYQYLSIYLASLINDNPGAFIEDLDNTNTDEIRDFLDQYSNDIMAEQVITPLWVHLRTRLWGDMWQVVSGNALAWVSDVSQQYGGYFRQNPAAINNELEVLVALTAGQYRFFPRCIKNSSSGIVTYKLDGVNDTTNDRYSAALTYNDYPSGATIDVTDTGLHTLGMKVASKNASSSNYQNLITYVDIYRLGDL